MLVALQEAVAALEHGDVPVGAVVLDPSNEIVAQRHNERERTGDPTAHAEILALRDAAANNNSWHLDGYTLVVTLEPCPMCAGAAVNSRLATVVYGAADMKAGSCLSLMNIGGDPRLNHQFEIVDGVLPDEASALLSKFFAALR
ncbi:MAG: nucleoside deaminase [Acidimicrobiales bacterium]|nr:nucleoside deaminase [Acidimicrobiales bacterium]